MPYRIALCGFSTFEYRAMQFSFQYPADPAASGYDIVDALADADFAVVDADSKPAVKGVVQSGRVAQAVFVGADAPEGASSHLQRPIDPNRILRALDELTSRRDVPSASAPLDPPITLRPLPRLEDVVAAPSAPRDPIAWAASSEAALPPLPQVPLAELPPPLSSAALKAAARAATRAAVRRNRMARDRAVPHAAEPLRDVLVLDADGAAAAALCALLEHFGFVGEVVATIAHAREQLATRAFAAIFLDIPLDGSDRGAGVALLQRIQQIEPPAGHTAPAVLLVAAQLRPADRVRASLAGIGAPLIKPVSRGDVARALEGCGVPFPADARRH